MSDVPIFCARYIPDAIATEARDGIMKKILGVSLLATSTLTGISKFFITFVITRPMNKSNPVHIPPVNT